MRYKQKLNALSDVLRNIYKPRQYQEIALPYIVEQYGGDPSIITGYKEIDSDLKRRGLLSFVKSSLPNLSPSVFLEASWQAWGGLYDGAYFTPSIVRDVMLSLAQQNGRVVGDTYDPTCGTNGLGVKYGQELSEDLAAIARLEYPSSTIRTGNTLVIDQFPHRKFDTVLANPPFGVNWKSYAPDIKRQTERYPAFPRISDGIFLFLWHCLQKLNENGVAIVVTSGSPLFVSGKGENIIRGKMLDHVQTIVGLPPKLFLNTAIPTFVWVIGKNPSPSIRLVDMREADLAHDAMGEGKTFANDDFRHHHVKTYSDERGKDVENVPYGVSIDDFMSKHVLPYDPFAVVKSVEPRSEINFNKHFYVYKPLRPLDEITADILELEEKIRTQTASLLTGLIHR